MESTVRDSVCRPEGWLATKLPVEVDDSKLRAGGRRDFGLRDGLVGAERVAGALDGGSGQKEDLGDGTGTAGDGVGGIGSGVEVEQFAEDGASARAGILRKGERLLLGQQRAVGIVGDEQGGLLRLRHDGGVGGGGVFAGQEALMGALAQLPEDGAHDRRGNEEKDEENGLIAGNHG